MYIVAINFADFSRLTGLELWQIQDQELDYMNQPLDLPPEKSSAQWFPQTFLQPQEPPLLSYVVCFFWPKSEFSLHVSLVKMQPLFYGHNTVQRSISVFLYFSYMPHIVFVNSCCAVFWGQQQRSLSASDNGLGFWWIIFSLNSYSSGGWHRQTTAFCKLRLLPVQPLPPGRALPIPSMHVYWPSSSEPLAQLLKGTDLQQVSGKDQNRTENLQLHWKNSLKFMRAWFMHSHGYGKPPLLGEGASRGRSQSQSWSWREGGKFALQHNDLIDYMIDCLSLLPPKWDMWAVKILVGWLVKEYDILYIMQIHTLYCPV